MKKTFISNWSVIVLGVLLSVMTFTGTTYATGGGNAKPPPPPVPPPVTTPSRAVSDIATSKWVEQVFAPNSDFKLTEIVIPGTHDSGTYDIDCFSKAERGASGILVTLSQLDDFLGYIGLDSGCFVSEWARTHDRNFYRQLEDGIRYFDFRINYSDHVNTFVLTHALEGSTLQSALNDVARFASSHPKEIIIIEAEKLPDDSFKNSFHQMIQATIGKYLIPRSYGMANITISDAWNAKRNILLILDKDSYASLDSNYWYGSAIVNSWANTTNESSLKSYSENKLNNRDISKLLKTSLTFTMPSDTWGAIRTVAPKFGWWPWDSGYWDKGYFSVEELSQEIKHTPYWVRDWIKSGKKVNIVNNDFYQQSPIVHVAIEANLNKVDK